MVDKLKLRGTEKLSFVHQIVYNTTPAALARRRQKEGAAGFRSLFNVFVSVSLEIKTSAGRLKFQIIKQEAAVC